MECDVCTSDDNVQSILIGVDGYGQYVDKHSNTLWLCKFCREGVIEYIEGLKEEREYNV